MKKSNSQARAEKIAFREKHIRKESKGISKWSECYVGNVAHRHGLSVKKFEPSRQEVVIRTCFGTWMANHDGKVVTLYHRSDSVSGKGKMRADYHKQDVFFNLNQALKSITDHERFIGYNR